MNRSDIVLATANARYSHPAFGLRYLYANLGGLQPRASIVELTLRESAQEVAAAILERAPRIVGLGVYVWNVAVLSDAARLIKEARPDVQLVIGGPEVSHEYEDMPVFSFADYLIRGEADIAFRELASALLAGERPSGKVLSPEPPDLESLVPPYDAYSEHDLVHRLTYAESTRGCPYRCAFCLSSLDTRVREFPLEPFLAHVDALLARGARRFKFVDRTFNLNGARVEAILRFLLARWCDGLQVHFEILPDRLDDAMLTLMEQFPPEGLRLEAGVQSFHEPALEAIARRHDIRVTRERLARLCASKALVHADLIAGLPHETPETFARGFDELAALRPHEIQVGILKRLKGTAIAAQAVPLGLVFASTPPYEIMATPTFDADAIARVKAVARCVELFYNSGKFAQSATHLFDTPSPYKAFEGLAVHVMALAGRTHAIPLADQARLLFEFLVGIKPQTQAVIARDIEADFYAIPGRKEKLDLMGSGVPERGGP